MNEIRESPGAAVAVSSGWGAMVGVLCWPNNLVTLSRILVTGLILFSLHKGVRWDATLASILFMAVFWYTDILDGRLAKRFKKTSSLGESLDLVADCACDLMASAYLLLHHPQYAATVVFFLLGRFGPDVLVIRYGGLTSGVYATLMQRAVQMLLPGRGRLTPKAYANWAIEAYSLAKASFFCGAIFWSAPVWTGVLLIVPAVIFLLLALMVLRFHAEQVLEERRQAGLES
jgi:phosphatidylglycerophosphate synthase